MPDRVRRDVTIAIAGAGLSGLGMAIALRRDGIEDFVVLERAGDLGGTWRDNSYPGCACDIASVLYSYADEQNPGWTRAFAGQAEIWAYMHEVAQRHDLGPHMRYGHEVLDARWDDETDRWEIHTTGGDLSAEIFISATGALADPAIPDLPGLERFGGTVFHSARWNHDHDLRGRRVAVIGTGASAIQFVPEIAPEVGHLDLYQRTPPWVLPEATRRSRRAGGAAWPAHPRLQARLREGVFSLYESFHYAFRHPALMTLAQRRARANIAREVADPALAAKLTPDYRLGCKRVLGSDAWYPALCRPNVDVITTGVAEVTADAIVDRDGTHRPVDTIIFGTGFLVTDPPVSHRIRGRDGTVARRPLAGQRAGAPRRRGQRLPQSVPAAGPQHRAGPQLRAVDDRGADRAIWSGCCATAASTTWRRLSRAWRPSGGSWPRSTATRGAASGPPGAARAGIVDATGRNSTLWPGSVAPTSRRLARFEIGDYADQLSADPGRRPRRRCRPTTGRRWRSEKSAGVAGRRTHGVRVGAASGDRTGDRGCGSPRTAARVAIVDQDEDGLAQTAELIAGPVLARARSTSATGRLSWRSPPRWREWAPAPIGMVFNNAGVATLAEARGGLARGRRVGGRGQLGGVVNGVRAFLPILLRQGSGVIVNTSSVFGLLGIPARAPTAPRSSRCADSPTRCARSCGARACARSCVHPGGVEDQHRRNARYHADPLDAASATRRRRSSSTRGSRPRPSGRREIIHDGVEAGRSRILVGPDAYFFDVLAGLAPMRYFDVLPASAPAGGARG